MKVELICARCHERLDDYGFGGKCNLQCVPVFEACYWLKVYGPHEPASRGCVN